MLLPASLSPSDAVDADALARAAAAMFRDHSPVLRVLLAAARHDEAALTREVPRLTHETQEA